MDIHVIDPLRDERWEELAALHPSASAFHQRGWLEALARTYGYKPFALTSAAAGERLRDALVLCRVSSWLTGTRLVSLPFADHCEPLLKDPNDLPEFMIWLRRECDRRRWRYVEFRPLAYPADAEYSVPSDVDYCFHELDVTGTEEQVLRTMHKNSFRRKIRRAEREQLSYEVGRSDQLLDEFYHLIVLTRRRHQLLPQPRAWFRNLVQCMGENVQIRLARKNSRAIATVLALRHGRSVIFKYGGSDARYHNLGGMPFLFWKLIQESKASGVEKIDLGRSGWDNPGLIVFKDRIGANRRSLTYFRHRNPESRTAKAALGFLARWRMIFSLPDAALSLAGKVLYRHMG